MSTTPWSTGAYKVESDFDDEDKDEVSEPLRYEPIEPRVESLDDVVGLDELKEELRLQLQVWAHPDQLSRLGGKARIGFVFSGPPGSGKTTSAHALAAETGKALYSFSGTDFQGERGRRNLVEMIDKLRGEDAIVFIDEADDLLHKRDFRQERSGPLIKTLLVNLDQTTQTFRAFFIFATNMHPNGIDDALLHAGRLGRPLIFRNLRLEERVQLLEHARKHYACDSQILLLPLASQMGDVPTANLAHLFDEGSFVAFRSGHQAITQEDLQEAAQRLQSGLERKKSWTDEELLRVSTHEAGHAIAQLVIDRHWGSVGFVQVSQRLEGNNGTTHSTKNEEGRVLTPGEVVDEIAISLAGGQAELLLLGTISSGHSSDLEAANKLADQAATAWGFGHNMTNLRVRDDDRYWDANDQETDWNATAARFLREGESVARALLRHEEVALTVLADRLRENRVADTAKLKEWLSELLPMVKDSI